MSAAPVDGVETRIAERIVLSIRELAADLRGAGVSVGIAEERDAIDAASRVTVGDLRRLHDVLRATLTSQRAEQEVFELLFELRLGTPARPPSRSLADLDDDAFREVLDRRVGEADDALMTRLGAEVARRWSGFEPGRPVGGAYYAVRALGAADLSRVSAAIAGEISTEGGWGGLLAQRHAADAVERLQRSVEAAVRELVLADRGPTALIGTLRPRLLEDEDLVNAGEATFRDMERIIPALARTLAMRLRTSHRSSGRLHRSRTLRRAVAFGGTPVELVFRPPRKRLNRIIVLADVSGSVASFAGFTMRFIMALSASFARVRVYAFAEDIVGIDRMLARARSVNDLLREIDERGDTVRSDGHSDYGRVFRRFAREGRRALTQNDVLIVLGDARNNFRTTEVDAFAAISGSVGEVHWLVPEPRSDWGNGDSAILDYAPLCTSVEPCRTLRELRAFVRRLT